MVIYCTLPVLVKSLSFYLKDKYSGHGSFLNLSDMSTLLFYELINGAKLSPL